MAQNFQRRRMQIEKASQAILQAYAWCVRCKQASMAAKEQFTTADSMALDEVPVNSKNEGNLFGYL
jgi:hypothetical protein